MTAAGELFNAGRYAEAAAAYEKLLKDFPTGEFVGQAQVELANADYLAGKFDDAAAVLRKFLAAPASQSQAELLESAAALLPETLLQKASALPAADEAKRKAVFEEAAREFGAFLGKYPRGAQADSALYGRAVAYFQLSRFDEAANDLHQNLRDFSNRETAPGSQFLLALTLASQAAKTENASDPVVAKNYAEAEKLLTDLITRKPDVALANDAQFQLGEVLAARAGSQPEAARAATLARALAAYRAVEGREPVVAAQTARVAQVRQALRGAAGSRAEFQRMQSVLRREQTKLGQLQNRDDAALSARLRSAGVFYQLKKYDETRVLLAALAPLATKPADEKLVLYYTALAFAAQNAADAAVAAYERFQEKFPRDPGAENLPLALGNMFLSLPKPDAARAEKFFADFAKMYPRSRLRELALLERADALAREGKFDAARRVFDDFLKANPKRELAAAAELGRARLLQAQGDLAGALAAFKKIRDAYADRPEAGEAAFWIGAVALQMKDAAGAASELKTFLGKFPQSPLAPAAQLALGRAQAAAGDKAGAQATLAELPGKFPNSPEAAQTYFLRANWFYADKNTSEMTRVLREFIEKYPHDEKVFDAADALAAVLAAQTPPRIDEALAGYQKFLDQNGDSPKAPLALLKLAALWKKTGVELGNYLVLGEPQRAVWQKALSQSVAASERLLEIYPDSKEVAGALANLVECQRLRVGARLQTDAQVGEYFAALPEKVGAGATLRSRVRFTAARLTAEKDPAGALAEMQAAYDPNVIYAPADLDQFTTALLRAGDAEAAGPVFAKAAQDYPLPNGLSPAQAPPDVQEAQALALYGQARLAEARGDADAAAEAYAKLQADYPRSNKLAEANLGLARRLVAQGKPDDALKLLSAVARTTAAPLEVRAAGLLLSAEIFRARNDLGAAIDAFLKVAAFYPNALPDAPRGLWEGAQLLENQAASLGDAPAQPNGPTRSSQLARARKAYDDLVKKYAASEFAAKARERLATLPPTTGNK